MGAYMRLQKLVFLVSALILTMCAPVQPTPGSPEPAESRLSSPSVPAASPSPSPVATSTPESTNTPTLPPTPVPTPTATTPPSPWSDAPITLENANRLIYRGQWGRGSIQQIEPVGEDRTLILSSLGVYLFQTPAIKLVAEYPDAARFLSSPDKTQAAILFPDRSVQLINLADGQPIHIYQPQGEVPGYLTEGWDETTVQAIIRYAAPETGMAFSSDNRYFAFGDVAGTISVWDNKDGTLVTNLYHDVAGLTNQLEFTSDNRHLISIGRPIFSFAPTPRLAFWSIEESSLLWYQPVNGRLDPALLSPDNQTLGIYYHPAGSNTSVIRLYRSLDGTLVTQISGSASDQPYTPDAALFVSTNQRNIQVEKIFPDVVHLRTLYTQLDYPSAEFSPDGTQLIVNNGQLVYAVQDFSLLSEGPPVAAPAPPDLAGEMERWLPLGFGDLPRGLVVLPDNQIYLWGGINPVWRWDPLAEEMKRIDFSGTPTAGPALSQDGSKVAICAAGLLEVHSFADGIVSQFGSCREGTVLAFFPDGNSLAAGLNNKITTFDISSGDRIQDYLGTGYAVSWLEFSPTGKFFASGGEICGYGGCLGDLHFWQVSPAKNISLISEESDKPVYDVSFTLDEESMIASKGYVWLWETKSGNLDGRLPLFGAEMALSPDDNLLAVGAEDGSIKIVSIAARQIIANFPAHHDSILALAFTPDGANLLSMGADGGVRLWVVP